MTSSKSVNVSFSMSYSKTLALWSASSSMSSGSTSVGSAGKTRQYPINREGDDEEGVISKCVTDQGTSSVSLVMRLGVDNVFLTSKELLSMIHCWTVPFRAPAHTVSSFVSKHAAYTKVDDDDEGEYAARIG